MRILAVRPAVRLFLGGVAATVVAIAWFSRARATQPAVSARILSVATGVGEPGGSAADEIAALGSIYESERGETASVLSVVLAMLGAGVGYLAATLAFSDEIFRSIGWTGVFIPLVLWVIAAYHSLLATTAMVRSLSIRAIESRLLKATAFTERARPALGLRATERILNINEARWPHVVATLIAYGGIALMILGYTVYMILGNSHLGLWAKVGACLGYATLALLIAVSWASGLRIYKEFSEHLGWNGDEPALKSAP